jgi:hypothetical protein
MAGVKVTDLTTLGTADAADIMYIVDTSANQSKQIEVQNLYAGMPQFESGSFTPVFTNETNSPVLLTSVGGQYVRINDIVIMSFRFNVQMNAGFNSTDFNFSLPIASTFTNLYELLGTNSRPSNLNGCSVYADITNNLGTCAVNTTSNGQTVNALAIIAQYQII